jgi:hypothetical protein
VAPRLDPAARLRVARAAKGALGALACEVNQTHADVARELGVPAGKEARLLVRRFASAMFGALS